MNMNHYTGLKQSKEEHETVRLATFCTYLQNAEIAAYKYKLQFLDSVNYNYG